MDNAFSKLDINGDGFISMEEIMDKLPLETPDPDDDMESERFLQVSISLVDTSHMLGTAAAEWIHGLVSPLSSPNAKT